MRIWKFISSMFLIFLWCGCAQPRALKGGDKDTESPVIIHSVPQNFSTMFVGNTIILEFDEYVVLKSLQSELVVSPPLKYPIEYTVKGKRVYLEIEDTLMSNTTYNFNLGNAIVDLNEGNVLDSNLFVISTGSVLDSGQIHGVVKDSYTLKPIKNATVLLFDSDYDSAIYKGGPMYLTKTNSEGEYHLKYLSSAEYSIYVMEHPGADYKYQPYSNIGFNKGFVHPEKQDSVNFYAFIENDTNQYLSKEFSRDYYSFILSFHSPLVAPKFNFEPTQDTLRYLIEEIESDSFKFWIEGDKDIDSVKVTISDDLGFSDTVKVNVDSRKKFYKKLKRKKETKHPLTLKLNAKNGVFDYFDTLRLNFSRPPLGWNTDSMLFVQGTDTMPLDSLLNEQIIVMNLPTLKKGLSKQLKSMDISYNWEPGQHYAFIFYSGSFNDIVKQSNDTTIFKFNTKEFEDYGSFRFTINVPNYDGSLQLELLNSEGKFIRDYEIKSGSVIYHELAKTGKYKLRLILDRNGNRKWDTGDLAKGIQPEEIVYYDGVIEIRPNWDMEETWNVNLK